MNKVFTPILASHSRTLLAVNSGPLSERMYLGTPRRTNRCDLQARQRGLSGL